MMRGARALGGRGNRGEKGFADMRSGVPAGRGGDGRRRADPHAHVHDVSHADRDRNPLPDSHRNGNRDRNGLAHAERDALDHAKPDFQPDGLRHAHYFFDALRLDHDDRHANPLDDAQRDPFADADGVADSERDLFPDAIDDPHDDRLDLNLPLAHAGRGRGDDVRK